MKYTVKDYVNDKLIHMNTAEIIEFINIQKEFMYDPLTDGIFTNVDEHNLVSEFTNWIDKDCFVLLDSERLLANEMFRLLAAQLNIPFVVEEKTDEVPHPQSDISIGGDIREIK